MSKLLNELVYLPELASYATVATVTEDGRIDEVGRLTTKVVNGQIVEEIEIIKVVSLVVQLVNIFDKIIKGLKDIKIKLNTGTALALETREAKREQRKKAREARKTTRKTNRATKRAAKK